MRIIFVPQFPTSMRYQEWWFWKIPEEFKKAGFSVLTLGEDYAPHIEAETKNLEMFSPIARAIDFETMQINEYMDLKFEEDDVLFFADISFPGFFSNVLFHKRPPRAVAFCHATSLNIKDYFESVRLSKFAVESAHSLMFDAVLVGSDYHENKLGWPNTIVTRLPYPPFKGQSVKWEDKYHDIISASRPTEQKVDIELENKIGRAFSPVNRPVSNSWRDYFNHLAYSKILLITSFEDTFGYQIVDAVINGCIPIAPNRCAYPELLPEKYLYNDKDELFELLWYALIGKLEVPKLKCHGEMEDFYKNIIEIVGG